MHAHLTKDPNLGRTARDYQTDSEEEDEEDIRKEDKFYVRGIIDRLDMVRIPRSRDVVLKIVDYKTGKENSSHEVQMRKYQALLEEMNLKVIEKILIYVNETIKISKYK